MKYNFNAKLFRIVFNKMLFSYYKKYLPDENIKQYKKDINREYKAMIKRTPDVGGSWLEPNLTMGCYFFSLAKTVKDMTPELLDKIIDEGIHSEFMVKLHEGKRKKGTIFSEKQQNKTAEFAKASQNSPYEMDWKYTYKKGNDEFYCTYTECGLCKLAKRENMEKFLPCLCKTDYANYENMGGKLLRTKTLANGDECCDFHVVRMK